DAWWHPLGAKRARYLLPQFLHQPVPHGNGVLLAVQTPNDVAGRALGRNQPHTVRAPALTAHLVVTFKPRQFPTRELIPQRRPEVPCRESRRLRGDLNVRLPG